MHETLTEKLDDTQVSCEDKTATKPSRTESKLISVGNIDVGDYLKRIQDVIAQVKDFSSKAKTMDYKVDSIDFSFERMKEEYVISLHSKISIKPKENNE